LKNRADKIEMVSVDTLVPHPKNCHEHSKEQIERLSKIIEYQGFRNPLTVQAGTNLIVTGHGRLMAAKKLGMKEVPVIYKEFESDEQLYAHLVADNAIGKDTWATLDLSLINTELENLGPDLDIDMLGLKDFEIEIADKLDPQTDEDEVPEVVDPISKRGDIWLLGNHRVMCGDSTMIDDVERLMNGEKFDLLTDPPYGISAEKMTMGSGKKDFHRGNDWDNTIPDFYQMLEFFEKQIIWGGDYFADKLPPNNHWLCWDKKNPNLSFSEFELAWSNVGKNCRIKSHHWGGEKKLHVTMKPVAVMEWCLGYLDNNIFDLFLGSGSTLIACEKTNRKCYGMELDEHYCDVIIKRWQNYTGKEATLESTGETYNSLKEAQNGKA
jgi:DNA modification methylase